MNDGKRDDESDLIYMRARYYEPSVGRFISQDPAMDGANWFVYCDNDPVGRADRDGRVSDAVQFALGTLMFLIGLVLTGVCVPELDKMISRLDYDLRKNGLKAIDKVADLLGDRKGMYQLEAIKKMNRLNRIKGLRRAEFYLGYSLICMGLILDIEAAGPSILEFVYGRE